MTDELKQLIEKTIGEKITGVGSIRNDTTVVFTENSVYKIKCEHVSHGFKTHTTTQNHSVNN